MRVCSEPQSNSVASPDVITFIRVVVFRMKIVIQEDGIIRIRAQELLSGLNVISHVKQIVFETFHEPLMSFLIVVEEEDANRIALELDLADSKFGQQ